MVEEQLASMGFGVFRSRDGHENGGSYTLKAKQ